VDVWNLNSEEEIKAFLNEYDPDNGQNHYNCYAEGVNGTAWSPDGEWIAWITRFGLDPNPFQIMALMVRDVERQGPIRVLDTAHYQKGSEILNPCWSPDSEYIVYSRGNSPLDPGPKISNLVMVARDGTGEVMKLTDDQNLNGAPAWCG
jgi:Tol biopolymer transport system component